MSQYAAAAAAAAAASGEESIYRLIPEPEQKRQKPPRYTSKFPGDIPPTASTFGVTGSATGVANVAGDWQHHTRAHADHLPHSTFGPKTLYAYYDPTAYHKKQSQPPLPEPTKHTYKDKRKAPLVSKNDVPPHGLRRDTNHVRNNAIAAAASPKKQTAVAAATKPLQYVDKPDYGKVPEYLHDVKAELHQEKAVIAAVVANKQAAAAAAQPQVRLMDEEERQVLLHKLKSQWEQVNAAYQTMTHNTVMDTKGKMRRKEECEQQLQQLEKSIEKLSKKLVYVHDA